MFRVLGSPPRVREPRNPAKVSVTKSGITPACAGTTSSKPSRTVVYRDHPRVCGNHFILPNKFDGVAGSPPRVREPRPRGSVA